MLVQCPSCSKKLNVPDSAAGKKAKCPGCAKLFEVVAATAVAPAAPKSPPVRPAAEDDVRPRKRPAPADEEDEEVEEEERPRGKRPQVDDDEDDAPRARGRNQDDEDLDELEEVEDRPARRERGGNPRVLAGIVSWWLRIAGYVLLGYFLISQAFAYLAVSMLQDLARAANPGRQLLFEGMAPMMLLVVSLVIGAIILTPCLVFIFLGSSRASQLRGRGFVLTGLILCVVLGSLGVLAVIGNILEVLVIPHLFTILKLVLSALTTAVLLFAGIRGLTLMGRLREAFAVSSGGRRGRDRDDDDEDDDDDRPRRRRR